MGDDSDIHNYLTPFDNRYDPSTICCLTLWAHVFKQGVTDYVETLRYERSGWRNKAGRTEVLAPDRPAVKAWFDSDDRHPGSFAWLCEVFHRDPGVTRSFIHKHWRTLHAPKERSKKGEPDVAV